jgi:allophanate hydrolase subunit 2
MASTLTLECIRPGGGAFLVDGGRPGRRALGIPAGGAADQSAHRTANRLLHRPPNSVCLETTLLGGEWMLSGKGQLTITGAEMDWRLNGQLTDYYTTIYLDGDYLLTGGRARAGCRSYLGIRGKWNLPRRLGSVEAGLPGQERPKPGWKTIITATTEADFELDLDLNQHRPQGLQRFPVLPGPEWHLLPQVWKSWLTTAIFSVSPDSGRQAIRLLSPGPPAPLDGQDMISSPVLPGTVQLTPSGPILLGPAAQTIGGYPRVLVLENQTSLNVAYQLLPGEFLSFHPPTAK